MKPVIDTQAVMSSSTRPGSGAECRTEQALADDLQAEIERHDKQDRRDGRARHVARRITQLA